MKYFMCLLVCALIAVPSFAASVHDAGALSAALADARPGGVITISGTISGSFKTSVNGSKGAPITIQGDGAAVLANSTQGESVLSIANDYYRVVNIATRGGQKGLRISGAHGILHNVEVSDTREEGFSFKRSGARYWLVENCYAHHTGLEGKYGEGFYVGDASENWLSDQPDTPGFITFYNCRTLDTVNDAWDIKEGAHHVKIINCTADLSTSAPLPASSLPYDHTGVYCRGNDIQIINMRIENLTSGRNLTAIRLFQEKGRDGITYGADIALKNIAAVNIPEGCLAYASSEKMRVTFYDDCSLTHVRAVEDEGSVKFKPVLASGFREMTWDGEGGQVYGNLTPAAGANVAPVIK